MGKFRRCCAILSVLGLIGAGTTAQALDSTAKQAFLMDMTTGTVLFEKNPDQRMPPSSMSKMMTLYVLFNRLKDGGLTLQDKLLVSEKAWRKGGSKMFVEVGKHVAVEDLIRGIAVVSGNDACIVVAEALSGTEDAFAVEMTKTGQDLGMDGSTFRNASGWPDPEHLTTARDLATLTRATIADFPDYYKYYGEKDYTFAGIKQGNRNPLVYGFQGGDGVKTGHTEAAGYGLVGSAKRDERRLILVLNGLASKRARSQESQRIMAWGFREYENYALFKDGVTVQTAEVWLGAETQVPLVVQEDVVITLPRAQRSKLSVKVVYEGPIPAPIQKSQRIATLVVEAPGMAVKTYPLIAAAAVDKLGIVGRLGAAIKYILWGGEG